MLKRIVTILLFIFFAIFLVVVQFSLLNSLTYPWLSINLLVIALVLVFLISNKEQAWFLAIALGYFNDLLSFQAFGATIVSLFLTAIIIYLILENWLTNRSLYSFMLITVIAIFVESLIYNLFIYIFDWSGQINSFFLFSSSFWTSLAWNILTALIIVTLSFHFLVILSRKLQPFFLSKK
ncbi:MAG: hypothetical protein EOM88_02490 [Clostridia bacterium]|nr:hypothetical protein [Clostridia bacterium]